MAAALGVTFYDENSESFIPRGGTLRKIVRVDAGGIDNRVSGSRFTVMCDVDNPLFGENGAAYIYGPQKGANAEQVVELDNGLRHFGMVINAQYGKDFSKIPGAGAAGGLGAGCMAFLGAELMSGIDAILKLCRFREHIADADLIITGEGKLDMQSFSGKVLSGIMREAGGVPVWSICGICDCDKEFLWEHGVRAFETSEGSSVEESMGDPEKFLRITTQKAMKP